VPLFIVRLHEGAVLIYVMLRIGTMPQITIFHVIQQAATPLLSHAPSHMHALRFTSER
jgi:hypothetical protein